MANLPHPQDIKLGNRIATVFEYEGCLYLLTSDKAEFNQGRNYRTVTRFAYAKEWWTIKKSLDKTFFEHNEPKDFYIANSNNFESLRDELNTERQQKYETQNKLKEQRRSIITHIHTLNEEEQLAYAAIHGIDKKGQYERKSIGYLYFLCINLPSGFVMKAGKTKDLTSRLSGYRNLFKRKFLNLELNLDAFDWILEVNFTKNSENFLHYLIRQESNGIAQIDGEYYIFPCEKTRYETMKKVAEKIGNYICQSCNEGVTD